MRSQPLIHESMATTPPPWSSITGPMIACPRMLRAHLIMNPEARGVTPSLQHLMTTAMQARFRLGVTETHARDDAHRSAKRRYGEPYFYAAALATFAASYALKKPFLSCEGDFGTEEAVMAIGLVSDTYAYLVGRRLRLAHAGSPSGKLGLFLI